MKRSLTTAFLFLISFVLHGQLLHVKNIPDGSTNFVGTNNLLFFTDAIGSALWISDGTEAGTISIQSGLNFAGNFVVVGSRIFFQESTGNTGNLWVSDGTPAGTKNLSVHSGIYEMYAAGNRLAYIVYADPGYELWISDGTTAGTRSLASVSFHTSIVSYGDKIVFTSDSSQGTELWISDGTTSGTHMIKDINPGPESGLGWAIEFKELNGILYFPANDGTSGFELWKTDGTESGTQIVKDLNPGSGDSRPHSLVVVEDKLFFLAETPQNGLWKTDGTQAGTELIKSFNYEFSMFRSIVINGILYFADQGDNTYIGLYRSDGTTPGTYVLETIYGTVVNLFDVNNTFAYIIHLDNLWYLYRSNGMPNGSTFISSGIWEHQNAVIEKYLYFTRTYFIDDFISYNDELGQTDLTASGTNMLKDLYTSFNTNFENSWNLVKTGNSLFFTTKENGIAPSITKLWKLTPEEFLVTSYTLVNSDTDEDIRRLKNHDTIFTDQKINIRADIYGSVGSVKFYLNGNPYSLESSAPFALAGDNNSNYREWTKPSGHVTVAATPYPQPGAGGIAGNRFTLHLNIISPQDTISGPITFTLVNALTNEDLGPLANGQIINLSSIGTNKLNIRANSNFPGTESIVFSWQGNSHFRTENTPPYALFADNNGDYNQWNATPGTYSLGATPYTGNNAGGSAGPSGNITFSIINSAAPRITAYPNPSVDAIDIQLESPTCESCKIIIADMQGKLYYNDQIPDDTKNFRVTLEELGMPAGMYFIKIQNAHINEYIKITKDK